MDLDQTRTDGPVTDKRGQQQAHRPRQGSRTETLYQVPLTAADVQLIRACSSWICQLGPAPDIRDRLVHLEQQLAGARPAP